MAITTVAMLAALQAASLGALDCFGVCRAISELPFVQILDSLLGVADPLLRRPRDLF
jgi:hypothetical protein